MLWTMGSRRRVRGAWSVVVLAVAAAGCGGPEVERSARPVWCPRDVPTSQAFDAREVLGLRKAKAAQVTRKAGCALVAVREDDVQFAITANFDPKRLQVEIDDGIVTRLRGVN
jgi:hypothetical protein